MTAYYARRAAEYERVYAGPRWQDDLAVLHPRVAQFAAGRLVLEIACGTGFWIERAAERARGVHATDLNEDTLALARAKTYTAPVTFERRDAYAAAARGPRRASTRAWPGSGSRTWTWAGWTSSCAPSTRAWAPARRS